MASPGNQHCANCIGTFSFPIEVNTSFNKQHMIEVVCQMFDNLISC